LNSEWKRSHPGSTFPAPLLRPTPSLKSLAVAKQFEWRKFSKRKTVASVRDVLNKSAPKRTPKLLDFCVAHLSRQLSGCPYDEVVDNLLHVGLPEELDVLILEDCYLKQKTSSLGFFNHVMTWYKEMKSELQPTEFQ
jgi:hypothetical protein